MPHSSGDWPESSDSSWDLNMDLWRSHWSVERAGWLLSGVKDDASLDKEKYGR